jgi:peptidoglycan pentaglycine glycine transferase (the first glycine)
MELTGQGVPLSAGGPPRGLRGETVSLADGEWDRWVDTAVGGDFRQSRGWAEAKALLGWRAVPIVVRDGTAVVAGAQLLVRRWGRLAPLGYVPRGPWLIRADEVTAAAAVEAVVEHARRAGVRLLCLAPPDAPVAWGPLLRDRGMAPTTLDAAPRFSTVVDLRADDDILLARMRSKTRYNVRLAQRRGVVIRAATLDELGVFYELYRQTLVRHALPGIEPLAFFETLCRSLDENGHVRLLIADVDGRAVAAMLLTMVAGVATYYRGGWSGEHADRHPNEALHYAAMRLARTAGCRHYDFEDISIAAAQAFRAHGRVERSVDPLSAFKLSFGGDVTEFSVAHVHVRGMPARMAYRLAVSRGGGPALRSFLQGVGNLRDGQPPQPS